jgi:hypothetical protein
MTEPKSPSIGELAAQDPNASPIGIIQAELPAIAAALVALAKSGSVQACKLCFDLGNPSVSLHAALSRALDGADLDTLDEIADILSQATAAPLNQTQ